MTIAVARSSTFDTPPTTKRVAAFAAIALHAIAGAAVLAYEPARTALATPASIAVEWISAPRIAEPLPAPEPVKIAPLKPKPAAPSPPPFSEPTPKEPTSVPAPAAAPPPAAPPVTAPAEPGPVPAPVAVTPPIFNADYLANPAPPYPALSRRTREQGRVILRVHVTPGGTVDEVEVRASSGHARLDDSALETVRRWKFIPAKRGAEPIAAWVLVPISFGLES